MRHLAIGAALGLLAVWMTGCTTVIRIGASECVALDSAKQVISIGSGCEIQRVYK